MTVKTTANKTEKMSMVDAAAPRRHGPALDWSRLLGFDQASAPASDGASGAPRVRLARVGVKVGAKPGLKPNARA